MEILFGLLAGVLMAGGVWLILSRDLLKFLFGLVLISNVANLVIFASGGVTEGRPPLVGKTGFVEGVVANSLPQALVLTAIVIGFGLVSFTLTLALRAWQSIGTTHLEAMCLSEQRAGATDEQGGVLSTEDFARSQLPHSASATTQATANTTTNTTPNTTTSTTTSTTPNTTTPPNPNLPAGRSK